VVPTIDGGQLGKLVIVSPVVPTIDAGKLVIGLASAGASPRPCPCRRSTAGNSASRSSCRGPRGADVPPVVSMIDAGKLVIDLTSAGASPAAVSVVSMIDAGKLTAGKLVIVPRSSTWQRAAVSVVPMIDAGKFQGKADAGKLVIDLASAGASPAAVPVVSMIDAGKLTAGKLVIVSRSSTWQRAAVPVVPTIDGGQFQGEADAGQTGHRPGKRGGLPAAVPVPTIDGGQLGKLVIGLATCRRGPRGADDRRREADAGQGGHRVAVIDLTTCRRGPRGADDRRRQGQRWASRSSAWQRVEGFPRGRTRGADPGGENAPSPLPAVVLPRARRPSGRSSTPAGKSEVFRLSGLSPRPE
jgi:hypothetical protein